MAARAILLSLALWPAADAFRKRAAPAHLGTLQNATAPALRSNGTAVARSVSAAAASGELKVVANASANASRPFTARVPPAVGKVFSLYYSSHSAAKATSVEAMETYTPAERGDKVWLGPTILPEPSCPLKLRSQTNYPTALRKANLRLAELAICDLLESKGRKLPSCGASEGKVCEMSVHVPMPASDEQQEPYIGAAMALAAYSKLCAIGTGSRDLEYKCELQRSDAALCAGLALSNGHVQLKGLPSPGLLDLKLDDAYILKISNVYLASGNQREYHETKFYHNLPNVLKWSHTPPKVHFCQDLSCLERTFIAPR